MRTTLRESARANEAARPVGGRRCQKNQDPSEELPPDVDIDYEPLPVVVDAEDALKPGVPLLYPHWGDNIIYHQHIQGGDGQKGCAEADLVISERFQCHRTGAQPMETRGLLASYDEAQGLTLWLTTQRPHNIRDLLASYMQLPHDRVRFIQPRDMGSAFGNFGDLCDLVDTRAEV